MKDNLTSKVSDLVRDGNHKEAIQLLQDELIRCEDTFEACFLAKNLAQLFREINDTAKAGHYFFLAGEGFIREGEIFQAIAVHHQLKALSDKAKSDELKQMIGETFSAGKKRRKDADAEVPIPTPFQEFSASVTFDQESKPELHRSQLYDRIEAQFALFSSLRAPELESFLEGAVLKKLKVGEILYREGDPSSSFYVVVSGNLLLSSKSGFRRAYDAGDFMGDLTYMAGQRRGGMISAQAQAEVLEFPGSKVLEIFKKFPNLKERVWRFYEKRLFLNMASRSELFRGLLPEELFVCYDQLLSADVSPGRMIVKSGVVPESFYFLVQGQCEIKSLDGTTTSLCEGHFINVDDFIRKTNSSSECVAKSPLYLLEMHVDSWGKVCDLFPRLAKNSAELAAKKVGFPITAFELID